jgi:hypothetical protein
MLKAPGATPASVRGRLAGLRSQYGIRSAELVPGGPQGSFRIHVQREDADTDVVPLAQEDGDVEQAVSLWEEVSGKTNEDAMAGFQNWRSPGRGAAVGHGRAVPVRLSEISAQRIRSAGDRWINRATGVTATQRQSARDRFHQRVDAAVATREETALYRRLREAASTIQDLYGGRDIFSLDVEHLDEIAQNRDIYPRTSVARRYARISTSVRDGGTPGSVERQIVQQARNPSEARQIARLYAEQQIEQELGDTIRSAGGQVDPVDIDLEIIDTEVHARVTARRAASRR